MQRRRLSTVKAKITALLLVGVSCIGIIGAMNKYIETQKNKDVVLGRESYAIVSNIHSILRLEERFIFRHDDGVLEKLSEKRRQLQQLIKTARDLAGDEKTESTLGGIIQKEKEFSQVFDQIIAHIHTIDTAMEEFVTTSGKIAEKSTQIVDSITQQESLLIMEGENISLNEISLRDQLKSFVTFINSKMVDIQGLFLFSKLETYRQHKKSLNQKINSDVRNIDHLVGALRSPEYSALWKEIKQLLPTVVRVEESIVAEWKTNEGLAEQIRKMAEEVQDLALSIVELTKERIHERGLMVDLINLVTVVVGGLGFLVLGFFISRSVQKSLIRVIEGLRNSAGQVSSAAEQISEASHSLARKAAEQASSVEEASSSLEEIASMSRETSDLTRRAEQLMNENIEKSGQSLKNLVELTENMSQVEADSDHIAQITKTIDEIAFQTNLLALNAAVEAARAGEAGAGFAIVADEVRNLAMRAKGAADSTQELLQSIMTRVTNAAGSLKDLSGDFEGIIESATVMGEKTSAVTDASKEQSRGLEQVNRAASEIDGVSQYVAASAEESAAASEELSAQAEQMKDYVQALAVLVGKVKNGKDKSAKPGTPRKAESTVRTPVKSGDKELSYYPKDGKALPKMGKELSPEGQIPFDEDEEDFGEF